MRWKTNLLSEVAYIGDGAHASLKRVAEGIPYITAKNVQAEGLDYTNMTYISEDTYNTHFSEKGSAVTKPREGDVLYSIIGSIGGVYEVKDEKIGISSSIAIFRAKRELISPKYLAFFLRSSFFTKQVQAIKGGVAQGFMSLGKLGETIISYPVDLSIQKRIVDYLQVYDSLIENNQKQIKLLEEAARRLYKEWFVDLHFPGYEEVQIADGIPNGWMKKHFGDTVKVVRGRSYASKELSETDGVLMINLSNIRPYGGYIRDQEKHYLGRYTEEQIVKTHELIMGVTDMTQERRTVGRVAIVPDVHAEAMISMDLIKLVPNEGSTLFYYSMLSYGGYSELISRFANGTNVLHLRPEVLNLVDVILPPMELQIKYAEFFEKIQNKIDVLQDQILYANEARNRLLPKLMSGKIGL